MKRFITLLFALAIVSFSVSQTNETLKTKRSAQEASIKIGTTEIITQSRAVDCLWESDFSNSNDWTIAHDPADCSLDWEIGQGLECGGFFPTATIESENGYYAMLDSDEYGGEEGGTEVEDSWLTMANPVDLSNFQNVVVEFDTWYRTYNSERCFLVVSTDGTFPTDLTPTTEADPANGIYEIFPELSNVGDATDENPTTKKINISEAAGGQSQVWIRFNWTGTWGYTWFIDRVCIAEQPADDITLSYGVVSHNGTGEEYGRTPASQLDGGVYTGGGVYNFGINAQTDVALSMEVTNSAGTVVANQSGYTMYGYEADADGNLLLNMDTPIYGPVASDENVYFEDMTAMDGTTDTFTATFTATSSGDSSGDYFSDNSATREFAITEDVYSTDGIDVYTNADISRLGTGSFTDATDGFIMMSYYDIKSTTSVAGARIYLDSYAFTEPLSVAGGELVVAIRDTANVLGETFNPTAIASSDFYLVTDYDVNNNGFVTVAFDPVVNLNPGAYFLSVEMYSNGNANDIYILDDETIPQPSYLSMIYIPGDAAYTNGTAAAIRMLTGESPIFDLEENANSINIYPNPSNGIINIDIYESGTFTVQINDMLGKLVSEHEINSSTNLNLENLDKGVYFINVSNESVSKNSKLIIE